MEKYTAYKPSGIKWIGEIPEHWELRKLKYCVQLIGEKILPDSTLPYVGMENIESWSGKFIESSIETEGLANRFMKNDILFGKLRPYLAKVYLAEFNGYCSSELLVYRSKTKQQRFFQKILIAKGFIDLVNASTYGAKMPRANSLFIGNQLIPIPPTPEQEAIVAFLEKATANIDAYIKQTEQEINTLNELKQAEIAQVVTKGLNPNAPMKDSGIAWIGDIPEYWDVLPFKAVFTMKSITNRIEEELLSVYLDKGVIKFSDVETKRTNTTSQDLSKYQLVEKGDFVLNNQQAWRGSVGVSMYKGIVSPAYIILSLSNKFNIKYANYLLRDKSMVTNYF